MALGVLKTHVRSYVILRTNFVFYIDRDITVNNKNFTIVLTLLIRTDRVDKHAHSVILICTLKLVFEIHCVNLLMNQSRIV